MRFKITELDRKVKPNDIKVEGDTCVTELSYSPHPEVNYLAAGTSKGDIYLYSVNDNYKQSHSIKGCYSLSIKTIDWDVESKFLQVASRTNEYGFVDVIKGRMVEDPNLVRNTEWNTISCKFGFNVQV